MAVYFFVLVAMSNSPYLKDGDELPPSKQAYFSEASCAADARLIAQSLFIKEGTKYGFKCVKVDYEPPNLGTVDLTNKPQGNDDR